MREILKAAFGFKRCSCPRIWKQKKGSGAIVAAAVIGAAGGIYSSSQNRKAGTEGGGVVTMPQYSFTEPRLKLLSDFQSQQMSNLSAGQPPPYLQRYLPTMERGMREDLSQTYSGLPGRRGEGVYGKTMETSAMAGLGPKSTMAQMSKAAQDYAIKSKQISDYINTYPMEQMNKLSSQYAGQNIPSGPNAQLISGQQIPQQPDYFGATMQTIGQIAPYLMGNNTTTPATTPQPSYWPTSDGSSLGQYQPLAYQPSPNLNVGGAIPVDYPNYSSNFGGYPTPVY